MNFIVLELERSQLSQPKIRWKAPAKIYQIDFPSHLRAEAKNRPVFQVGVGDFGGLRGVMALQDMAEFFLCGSVFGGINDSSKQFRVVLAANCIDCRVKRD